MPKPLFVRTHPVQVRSVVHPLLIRSVAAALFRIFNEKEYADKVIEHTLRSNPKSGSRDRAFIAETTYEVVRYYRLYKEILGIEPHNETDYWRLIGVHLILQGHTELEMKEIQDLKSDDILAKHAALKNTRAVRESIPDWMDSLAAAELGAQWDETMQWLNKQASVVLRTNRLKTTRKALKAELEAALIETREVEGGDALELLVRRNVFQTDAFKKGLFEVQDYSSQLVAPMLGVRPGMRVVDACAGGGGKALHLAALMENKGSLIALDTLAWKLDELKIRARRAGATNIETRPIENRKVIKRLYGSADRLLLDVPCSGLGVLRRNPDSKWKLSPEFIDNLRITQQDIIQNYSPIVKSGGRMVYATCSVLPSENIEQVRNFLESEAGKGWTLLEERPVLPQDKGFDGFYMALLEKA